MKDDNPKWDRSGGSGYSSDVYPVGGRASAFLEPGTTLARGRFVVERVVGRGANGVVYAARDGARDRVVAIKTLQLTGGATSYFIKHEFRSLRDVTHPNLIRLHELFVEGDEAFFSMDLVEGVPLDQYVRARGSTAGEASPPFLLDALGQLTSAVQALHRASQLHRDLKPANVLVDSNGRVVVLDFGLASEIRRTRSTVGSGTLELVGTPRYMAPELLQCRPATEKSDWYAVGVMLYEATTARPWRPGQATVVENEFPSWVPHQVRQLCRELLEGDPSKRADGARVWSALGEQWQRGAQVDMPTAELVGRKTQLNELRGAYTRACAGGVHVAFVSGVSGMGKTALLDTFRAEIDARATVLWGSCREQEAVSHKALDELMDGLTDLLCEYEPERILELIPPENAIALLQLFPSLARAQVLAGFLQPSDPYALREQRSAAYAALRTCFARLSEEQPLVVMIDDLQWGDADSARLLYDVFCAPEQFSCLLVLAFRSDEAEASVCLQQLLTGTRCLEDVREVQHIRVGPLSGSEGESLARRLLCRGQAGERAEQVRALCHEAQGSPLLLHELASYRGLPEEVRQQPVGLADVVQERLTRVSPDAREVFELVCVAGAPVREAVLARAIPGAEIAQAVVSLQTERLIRGCSARRPDAVEAVHDAIRKVGLRQLSKERRSAAHRQLANAYLAAEQPDVEALAHHCEGAGLSAQATYWAEQAAELAAARYAFDRAALHYRMALRHEHDAERRRALTLGLANALADAGRASQAAPLFIELAADGSLREALDYRQRAAEQWLVSGHVQRGTAVLREVLSEMHVSLPTSRLGAVLSLLVSRARTRLRGLDFKETPESEVDDRTLLRIDACRAAWALSFVSTLHGTALQARYLLYALDAGEPYRVALGLGMEAVIRSSEGDQVAVRQIQRRGREIAERTGHPHAIAFQHLSEGHCAYLSGRWRQCAAAAQRADALFTGRCRGSTWELNTLRFFWANALASQGQFRQLRRRLGPWLLDSEDRGDRWARAGFRLVAARSLRMAEDAPDKAVEEIEIALEEWAEPTLGVHRLLAEIVRGQTELYMDRPDVAVMLFRRLWREFRLSTLHRVQLCRVHMHHYTAYAYLALAAADSRRRERHVELVARHARGLRKEGVPWGLAVGRYAEAQLLRFAGKDEQAENCFLDAIELLEAADMKFHADSARYALSKARGTSDSGPLSSSLRSQGVVRPEQMMRMLAPGH